MNGFPLRDAGPRSPATAILAIAIAVLLWPVGAQSAEQVGRFVLKDGGQGVYLRLDTETGAISQCSHAAQVWSCKAVSDDRAVLHKEIARLNEENEALTARLDKLAGSKRSDQKLTLPSDADIDRVLAVFQTFLDRIFAFIRTLEQKQTGQGV